MSLAIATMCGAYMKETAANFIGDARQRKNDVGRGNQDINKRSSRRGREERGWFKRHGESTVRNPAGRKVVEPLCSFFLRILNNREV